LPLYFKFGTLSVNLQAQEKTLKKTEESNMNASEIQQAIEGVEQFLRDNSERGPQPDIPAIATIEDGLRCRIETPDGNAIYTDMPGSVGGSASASSPGWHLRAALASCDATLLAMRAARLGLKLNSIQVRVEASSDGRGMFLDEGVSPGSEEVRLYFKIGARRVSAEQFEALVHWVEQHSPVGTDILRAVDVRSEIETI
jgi:uncharacterized OsmC-like protein